MKDIGCGKARALFGEQIGQYPKFYVFAMKELGYCKITSSITGRQMPSIT